MNKVVLMSTIALLALSIMIISPVKAVTVESYWAHHEMDLLYPGVSLPSKGPIQGGRGLYWYGTNEGSLGEGTLEIWYYHYSLNTATGEGTSVARIRVTIPGAGTIEGIARGIFTGFIYNSGTFECSIGTGDFEDLTVIGTYSAVMTSQTAMQIDCTGTSIYH